MKPGVIFPQTEIGVIPGDIAKFAAESEALGYRQIVAYDHIVGVDVARRPDFVGPFNSTHCFHETLTLFAFMAACTSSIRLMTGVMVLPQRQTALVAKQAAEVDVLSGGRLTLGVGVGWNKAEYDAQQADFSTRGRRFEEQIMLLRELWTADAVDFEGTFDRIEASGINPLPVQRPIPLWLGTSSTKLLERVARLGDGWIPFDSDPSLAAPDIVMLKSLLREHRPNEADEFPIEGNLVLREWPRAAWKETIHAWAAAGATQVSVACTGLGIVGVDEHLDLLAEVITLFDGVK